MNSPVNARTRDRGVWAIKHTVAVYFVAHAIFAGIMAGAWVFLFDGSVSFAAIVFLSEFAPYQDWQMLGSWPLGLGTYLVALPVTLLLSEKAKRARGGS